MRDYLRKSQQAKGLPVDPEGEIVEIQNTPAAIREEIQVALREFESRGCACKPSVVPKMVKGGPEVEGKPVLETFFVHEDWCPFLRIISEGNR